MSTKFYQNRWFKWIASLIIPLILFFIPETEEFTRDIKLFFCITIFVMEIWAMGLLPNCNWIINRKYS